MGKLYDKTSGFGAWLPRPLGFTFIVGCGGALLGFVLGKVF